MNGHLPTEEELNSIKTALEQGPSDENADSNVTELIETLNNLDDMLTALDERVTSVSSSLTEILKGLGTTVDDSSSSNAGEDNVDEKEAGTSESTPPQPTTVGNEVVSPDEPSEKDSGAKD